MAISLAGTIYWIDIRIVYASFAIREIIIEKSINGEGEKSIINQLAIKVFSFNIAKKKKKTPGHHLK